MEDLLSTAKLSIGEVARRAGIKPSAIRYYEEVGLLPEPGRVGGKRCYDEGVLRCLANIKGAKRVGFTIEEMCTFFYGFPTETAPQERWQALAHRKLKEVDESISRLRRVRKLLEETLRCECASLDECAGLLADS
jgi:MerR family redox-sensitive transcriptional activator SoxR